MSTSAELVTLVRDVIDLDEDDLPLSLVRTYLRDGYQRVINLERRWPFLETSQTFNTVADQRSYPIAAIGNGTLREIISIVDSSTAGNRLQMIAYDDAERIWIGNLDVASRPLYFAEWAESINLWPKPQIVYPMIVRGYRYPTYEWLTNTLLQVDADVRLHTALAYYAIAMAYKRQEDPELAKMYEESFEDAVQLARKDLMHSPSARPMIYAGGAVTNNDRRWMQELGRAQNWPI